MLFGAHVSIAGALTNAPVNAKKIGCEVFQIFTRSPQGGHIPPCDQKIGAKFKKTCQENQQKEWYIHAPYFINFASANNRIYRGSIYTIRQELERANLLGAKYLMTHLGSYKDLGEKAGFKQLVSGLSDVLKDYTGETKFLIEISAGSGKIIGDTFEEIAEIIHHPKLKKYKLGVCYDTQHGFASGYDIRDTESATETLTKFDQTIGLKNLKLSHCNDSLTEINSHKDRHAHLGEGLIGKNGFTALLRHTKLPDINFICETSSDKVAQDIKLLKKIRVS